MRSLRKRQVDRRPSSADAADGAYWGIRSDIAGLRSGPDPLPAPTNAPLVLANEPDAAEGDSRSSRSG